VSKQKSLAAEFTKGLWEHNPVWRQLLGLCPVLAVTTSAINGVGMGVASTFVLVCASLMVSLLRKAIPGQVRIASFIVVIATFVTIVDLSMKAKFPAMSQSLGAFIPLIVVNCLILGRQEAFASKNNPLRAIVDALGMGLGFTLALTALGGVRELLGNGTLFGTRLMPGAFEPWIVMILPAGAFLTLGLMLGVYNKINQRRADAAIRAVRAAVTVKEA
jgi:Na+-translocating ferredoxin:NAD+ oxidoreductase subunit E